MDTLRRRIPSKLVDGNEETEDTAVLDEEQQDALIDILRKENEKMNQRYSSAVQIIIGLSIILQVVAFGRNPLLSIYPIEGFKSSLPLPTVFTILAIFIHCNLTLFFCSNQIRVHLQLSSLPAPLSYELLYLLSAVAPTLSLFLHEPWQTTIWWCVTPVIILVVQTILDAVQQSIQGIADLENMKYVAPGA